jgi:hypothetical protein
MNLTMHQEEAIKMLQSDRLLRVPIEQWQRQVNYNTRKSLIERGLVTFTPPATGKPIQIYAMLVRRML